jgi:prephenate dehydrogenase
MLRAGDSARVSEWIGEAVGNRQRLLVAAYASAEDLYNLRVHVPDRPGELATITQTLGAAGINIEGFDLEHFSRERGGVLTLLVTGEDEAARAAGLLEDGGYGVVVSSVSSGDLPS